MKKTITQNDFIHEFLTSSRKDQFTIPALKAIYDYLKDLDPDSELDVIVVCTEFTEITALDLLLVNTAEEVLKNHIDSYDMDCDEMRTTIPLDNGNYVILNA